MENYTKNGLMLIFIGLIIGIIASVILGLYYYLVPIKDMSSFLATIGFAIIGAIGGLLTLIGGILFFIGRKEFGEKHRKFVINALIILIVGIVLSVIVTGIGTFIALGSSIIEGSEIDFSALGPSILIATIISAITGGLAYIFALYELEDEKGRKILYIAFIVSIIVSVFIGYLSIGAIDELIETYPIESSSMDFLTSMEYTSSTTRLTVIGVISNILWAIAIYIPYKRIKNGELVAIPQEAIKKGAEIPERVCPNCNKSIPTDANNCPYCGKSFENYL